MAEPSEPESDPVERRSTSDTPQNVDERSALAKAWHWATVALVAAAQMVLPGLVGMLLDNWLGSVFLLTMVGFAAGTTLAIWQLLRLTKKQSSLRQSGTRNKQ